MSVCPVGETVQERHTRKLDDLDAMLLGIHRRLNVAVLLLGAVLLRPELSQWVLPLVGKALGLSR